MEDFEIEDGHGGHELKHTQEYMTMFYYINENFNMECYNVVRALQCDPDASLNAGVNYLSKVAASYGLDISYDSLYSQVVRAIR